MRCPDARLLLRRSRGLLTLTVALVAASCLVLPGPEAPLIDDWTYAWSVQELMSTGHLRLLDWSVHYPIAQVLWGALFTTTLGFSFFALRLSTLALAWAGLLAFYLTLRIGGVSRLLATLGTLVLFFNPVSFLLSYSFMTDVPFVCLTNVALLAYAFWVRRSAPRYLALGGLFTVAAFLVRQLGALTALVPIAYLIIARWRDGRRPRGSEIALSLLPLLISAAIWIVLRRALGTTGIYADKLTMLDESFLSPSWWLSGDGFRVYAYGATHALTNTGLMLSPLTLCLLPSRSRSSLAVAATIVLVTAGASLWWWGTQPFRVLDGVLSLSGLGLAGSIIEGAAPRSEHAPEWGTWTLAIVGLIAATILLATLIDRVRERAWDGVMLIMIGHAALQFAGIEILWLYHDRYYLTLLPALLYLTIRSFDTHVLTRVIMTTTLLVLASVSITGTMDHFRFAQSLTEARAWLLGRGVAAHEIDAGYTLNGWWLYARPENLPPGRDRLRITMVTTREQWPYVIASSPLPSYELLSLFPFPTIWASLDRLYVLEKR